MSALRGQSTLGSSGTADGWHPHARDHGPCRLSPTHVLSSPPGRPIIGWNVDPVANILLYCGHQYWEQGYSKDDTTRFTFNITHLQTEEAS